ncbi:MAG: NupC/NupG family nucleoside CNT transporter [Bacteroidetes bacterium]|nr:NupC/NupG family nucleoside CNT transporter [Bacteroidota bacterium]MBX7238477.1 NupC/NupG family nucleoside CNT transporter [Bacteroidia bacterium]MCW5919774.1 NupC/NupG family nucleoside CNT transporter [Bacteroidota bacterium]HCI57479.1 NupC/NupG family nucleoside CNT transporter [Bacteroidota bacterium]HMU78329.1 nucleoside transporter C-terminal domain-containing protein [Bacteroidia bacterium]
MDRFFGIFGFLFILGIAYLMSNNKKAINLRLVLSGLGLQLLLAFFILKTSIGQMLFHKIADFITKILDYALSGGEFVFGVLIKKETLAEVFGPASSFIFMFQIMPTIIFVAVLVSIAYHIGLMQRIVSVFAKGMKAIMNVSGAEALSNVSSAFVGQVEAQILIKPYISKMTMSELLASMTGSMACIAGGVMAVYISMGVPAEYLLAASIMAAPAALVISKIVYPETEESETKGTVKLEIKKTHSNLMDAISHGASDGLKVSLNVIAMLIGVIALIALIDATLGFCGRHLADWGLSLSAINIDLAKLSLKEILGAVFSIFAYLMGVPSQDVHIAGQLLGTKLAVNEFVAYVDFTAAMKTMSPKAITILSIALCGFANFSSVAIQVGGIGELAPSRRADLAKLGLKALVCGTLASYLSATLAGILM